ncbi:MAG: hypothetical protein AAF581_21505, partial [Planctomycetota bacterium]
DDVAAVVRTGVALAAGSHELLVKCDGTRFSLMLRDRDGHPVALTDRPADTVLLDAVNGDRDDSRRTQIVRKDITPNDLVTVDWWRQWQASKLDADRTLALALVLLAEGRTIDCRRVLARFEKSPGVTLPYAIAVTRAYDSLTYLPGDWRENWCARVWEQALAADPKIVPIRIAQAEELYAEDRTDEAMSLLREVLADQPQSLPALLLTEELCHHREWRTERFATLARLEELAPDHPSVLRRSIRRWEEVERSHRALPYRERRFELRPTASEARSLADSYRRLGKREQALAITRKVAKLDGNSTDSLVSQYQLLEELGADEEALAVIEQLIPRIPDDDRQHNARAKLMWQQGKLTEALASYQRALALTPGQITILQRIEQLEREHLERERPGASQTPVPFWEKYNRSLKEVLEAAPEAGSYPDAGAVLLFDLMVSRVGERGGIEEYVHQVIRIDSGQAIEEYSEFSVGGEALSLRVITPDGEELHPTSGDGSGGYTLPGLTPGAIIDYETILRRNVGRPDDLELGPFYFQDPSLSAAFHYTEWVVLLPEGWNPTIRSKNLPFKRREQQLDNGYREIVWQADAMDRPVAEPLAPPADEIVPNVWLHAALDWEKTLEEMVSSIDGADFPTPELEQAVATILADVSKERRAQVTALHQATCERVTGDLGGGNATDIWMSRAGDRDIALAGLLRTAGIPYRQIRIAQRDEVEPFRDWSLPSEEYFNYPLLEVPLADGPPMILSTRFRMAGARDYPAAFHGGRAVRLQPWGAEWVTLPNPPTKDADTTMTTKVVLADDGTAQISGDVTQHAVSATVLKERVKDIPKSQQRIAAERFVSQMLPGAKLEAGSFPELETPGEPFQIQFAASSDQLLQRSKNRYALKAVHFPAGLRQQFGGKPERNHPMVSSASVTMVESSTIELGPYQLQSVPEGVTLSGSWGSYQLRYRTTPGKVHLYRRLELLPCVLEPDACPRFLDACSKIDQHEAERLRLTR